MDLTRNLNISCLFKRNRNVACLLHKYIFLIISKKCCPQKRTPRNRFRTKSWNKHNCAGAPHTQRPDTPECIIFRCFFYRGACLTGHLCIMLGFFNKSTTSCCLGVFPRSFMMHLSFVIPRNMLATGGFCSVAIQREEFCSNV